MKASCLFHFNISLNDTWSRLYQGRLKRWDIWCVPKWADFFWLVLWQEELCYKQKSKNENINRVNINTCSYINKYLAAQLAEFLQ